MRSTQPQTWRAVPTLGSENRSKTPEASWNRTRRRELHQSRANSLRLRCQRRRRTPRNVTTSTSTSRTRTTRRRSWPKHYTTRSHQEEMETPIWWPMHSLSATSTLYRRRLPSTKEQAQDKERKTLLRSHLQRRIKESSTSRDQRGDPRRRTAKSRRSSRKTQCLTTST